MQYGFRMLVVVAVAVVVATSAAADEDMGWHPSFGEYFGVALDQPDYDVVRATLVRYLNGRMVDGVSPQLELLRFENFRDEIRAEHGRRAARGDVVRLYENMLDYLRVESQFDSLGISKALEEANEIVDRQRYITPDWNTDLDEQIRRVMAKRERIVPASVLFGAALRPYRPIAPPDGMILRELAVEPKYQSTPNTTELIIQLPEGTGPIARIDFETIEMHGLIVEASSDGQRYVGMDHIADTHPSGIRTPIIFTKPIQTRYLRLLGMSRTGPAHVRDFAIYTLEPVE